MDLEGGVNQKERERERGGETLVERKFFSRVTRVAVLSQYHAQRRWNKQKESRLLEESRLEIPSATYLPSYHLHANDKDNARARGCVSVCNLADEISTRSVVLKSQQLPWYNKLGSSSVQAKEQFHREISLAPRGVVRQIITGSLGNELVTPLME